MSKFLVEVSHANDQTECLHIVHVFLSTGSHFLANADWGCPDGEHKAWMIIDVPNREEALNILPPMYRDMAKVTQLTKFTLDDIEAEMQMHQAKHDVHV